MANIKKKFSLSAQGILAIEDNVIGIEDVYTGEFINFVELLADFNEKSIKMRISYDEDYGVEEE